MNALRSQALGPLLKAPAQQKCRIQANGKKKALEKETQSSSASGIPVIATTSNYERSLRFCCCNDIVAAPMWTLLLTHCPEYLKEIWGLSKEAQLVSI